MARYKVKCWETAVYEFTVEADEDADGAIRLMQPDDTHIDCDISDREWDITEE